VKKGTYAVLAELTFIVLLLSLTLLPREISATVVWSDDFDPPNLDNWTILSGGWTAENGYLECTENATGPYDWSIIEHASSVNTGTWSFDFRMQAIWRLDFYVNESALFYLGIVGTFGGLQLVRNTADLTSWDGSISEDWHHCDVTMDETFLINVFLDGTHIIRYRTLDPQIECEVFQPTSSGESNAFDNIMVSDTIDVVCPGCELDPTTTTTPTQTTTTTPPSTSPPPPTPLVPIEMIAIAGGVVLVIVVLVVFMKRR
jgi:hypothetical protein